MFAFSAPQTSTWRVFPVGMRQVTIAPPFALTARPGAFTSTFESGSLAAAGSVATSIVAMPRTIAAALTPLRDGGAALDDDAFVPYLEFLEEAGIQGVLLLGTTGEGILLSIGERKRAISTATHGPLPVLAHCGAQSTADTATLAAHAAEAGAEAVAVIAPPYFKLDDDALLAHFVEAARAC